MTIGAETLIQRASQDSNAFEQLFKQYMPLVGKVIKTYHLRNYTRDDWLQEARIAMLKAVEHFDGSQGSQFGAYYKMVLVSHIRSLLRKQFAQKRTVDKQYVLADVPILEAFQQDLVRGDTVTVTLNAELADFFADLSPTEQTALNACCIQPRRQRRGRRAMWCNVSARK